MRTTLSAIISIILIRPELAPVLNTSEQFSNGFGTSGWGEKSLPCQSSPRATVESSNVSVGSWGGSHISLQVTEKGAVFDLDCANGVIEEPLVLDATSRFSCKGKYEREHGGPDRAGQARNIHPAHFSGWSDGKTMTLVIKLSDTGQTIGEFTLTLGQEPQLTKCL